MRALPAAAAIASLCAPAALLGQNAELEGLGYAKGAPDAPVVVVEYADFACSACAEFVRDAWPALDRDYVAKGIVRWHLIPFELGFRNSEEGARAGECAGEQGAFWRMHDLLFSERQAWENERNPRDALEQIAGQARLDMARFQDCYEEKRGEERTKAANRAARDDGVRATPTFFINGFRVQGALPTETFIELIERARSGG